MLTKCMRDSLDPVMPGLCVLLYLDNWLLYGQSKSVTSQTELITNVETVHAIWVFLTCKSYLSVFRNHLPTGLIQSDNGCSLSASLYLKTGKEIQQHSANLEKSAKEWKSICSQPHRKCTVQSGSWASKDRGFGPGCYGAHTTSIAVCFLPLSLVSQFGIMSHCSACCWHFSMALYALYPSDWTRSSDCRPTGHTPRKYIFLTWEQL